MSTAVQRVGWPAALGIVSGEGSNAESKGAGAERERFLLAAVPASGFGASGCCRQGEQELGKEVQEDAGREAAGLWQDPGLNGMSHPWSSLAVLGKLAATYVEAIQSGAVPCLESAVLALAELENTVAVREAVTLYQDLMERRVKLPTETVQELLELHSQCERETLELFMARAFEDGICSFHAELVVGGPQPSQDSPGTPSPP